MEKLAPGLLIAMPQLGDPNFHRTVVLVIEHGNEGAMGLVLNRESGLTLEELGKGQSIEVAREHLPGSVFVGGPVEPQRGFVLHDSDRVEERQEVLPGLFLSVTVDALSPLLLDSTARLRFCMGYSGWGPQQLEQEINHGAWLFTEVKRESVLESEPGALWDATLRGMGVDPAMLLVSRGMN